MKGYTQIIYKFNNNNIIFDNYKTFYKLLEYYNNLDPNTIIGGSNWKNKYIKYKMKYLQLKNINNL